MKQTQKHIFVCVCVCQFYNYSSVKKWKDKHWHRRRDASWDNSSHNISSYKKSGGHSAGSNFPGLQDLSRITGLRLHSHQTRQDKVLCHTTPRIKFCCDVSAMKATNVTLLEACLHLLQFTMVLNTTVTALDQHWRVSSWAPGLSVSFTVSCRSCAWVSADYSAQS